MSSTMECRDFCTRINDPEREVATWLDNVVNDYRNRGLPRKEALQQAALALEITPRRAHAILYGQPFKFGMDRVKKIWGRYMAHSQNESDLLAMRAAAVRTRFQQASLDL